MADHHSYSSIEDNVMKLNKQKKAGLMLIGIGLLLITMVILSIMDKGSSKGSESEATSNVYQDIPEATVPKMNDSKTEAYVEENTRRPSIVEHWDNCMETTEEKEKDNTSSQDNYSTGGVTNEDLFGQSTTTASGGSASRNYENPYRESHQEREERHRRRQEEAIEMAERMQSGTTATDADHESIDETAVISTVVEAPAAEIRRSSVISSLDDMQDVNGISSLNSIDDSVIDDVNRPFKCMFSKSMKVRSGDRVSVILLEDMLIGGTFIPKNTHVMGIGKINDRLEMEITSIEMGGRIIPFGYEAYDIDGSKGIYCPDVGSDGKTIRSRGTSLASSTLNSRMGRIAGDIVNTGVSILQGRDGEKTVSIPAGYTFFIMKKKER